MSDTITDLDEARRIVGDLVAQAEREIQAMTPQERAINGSKRKRLRAARLILKAWQHFERGGDA